MTTGQIGDDYEFHYKEDLEDEEFDPFRLGKDDNDIDLYKSPNAPENDNRF